MIKSLEHLTEAQIAQCLHLLNDTLGQDLMGVYQFGSSIVGGLQRYSDVDLFVVSNRPMTLPEKTILVSHLLKISGVYQKSIKRPIEMMVVVKAEINPWRYPPCFDFQYGDWLRKEFEAGNIEPWTSKEMPDLAILITQVLLAHKILFGPNPHELLCDIPYRDFINAVSDSLKHLIQDLGSDTRNVILTLTRIWNTLENKTICSKQDSACWAIEHLPQEYKPVIERARLICIGVEDEFWDDIKYLIKPCSNFMVREINKKMKMLALTGHANKILRISS